MADDVKKMSTQELEALLRADFDREEGEDPALVEAALEELLRRERESAPESLPDVEESWERFCREYRPEAEAPARPVRRKLLRVCLLAAAIACFLSVTAFAALYQMWVQPGPESPEQYRIWDSDGEQQWVTRQPSLELDFSTAPEGNDYFFTPGWLPEEPNHSSTLKDRALGTQGEDYAAYGVTPEEAEELYGYMTCEDADEGVLYQISLQSPSQLYQQTYVLGYEGAQVEIVMDETRDSLRQLRLSLDSTGTETGREPDNWARHTNYVLLYNEEEGWLLRVQGTLDLESLARIAGDIRVFRSGHISRYEDNGQRMVSMDVGLG